MGPARPERQLLAAIGAADRPLSVREIAEQVHRHHTWVRPRLAELVRSGDLSARVDAPAGRGRPAMRYAVTAVAPRAVAQEHLRLMGVVAQLAHAHGFGGRDVERFGESHGYTLATERGGVGEVHRLLAMLGFHPRPRDDAPNVVPLGDCPLADLVRKPHGDLVCTLHRGLTRGIARQAGLRGADLEVASPDRGDCAVVLDCRRPTPHGR